MKALKIIWSDLRSITSDLRTKELLAIVLIACLATGIVFGLGWVLNYFVYDGDPDRLRGAIITVIGISFLVTMAVSYALSLVKRIRAKNDQPK